MIIDCGTCSAGPAACGDCVVTVLLGPPLTLPEIADDHRVAVEVLADSGLVPPLRLVRGARSASEAGADRAARPRPRGARGTGSARAAGA